jgi:hypothetical protein
MKEIWQNEDDEYYKLKPLTEKIVEQAERMLQVKLPKSYLNLLKQQNGGTIIYNAFPTNVPTSWAEDHIHIDHILGVSEEGGILQSEYLIQEWGLPKDIILFSGDGHSWIAFDYRHTKEESPIIYIDTEFEKIIELAPNFITFINGLYNEEEVIEDIDFEHEVREWTIETVGLVLSSDNEQEVTLALNYLWDNTQGNERFIEQQLINLLKSPILEFKQLGANFAYQFNETGVLSPEGVEKMVSIIQKDKEIEYYAEMYFSEN